MRTNANPPAYKTYIEGNSFYLAGDLSSIPHWVAAFTLSTTFQGEINSDSLFWKREL